MVFYLKFVKFITKLLVFVLTLLFICVAVKKVGEPILSRIINDPFTEELTNRAVDELVFPPSQNELVKWTKQLEDDGDIDHSSDVSLQYIQISGEKEGEIIVNYYRQYLNVFLLSSSYKADVIVGRAFEGDISISSIGLIEPVGEEYALNNDTENGSKQKTIIPGTNSKSDSFNEYDTHLSDDQLESSADDIYANSDGFEEDMNEFFVFVDGVEKGAYASKEEAISFARDYVRAEVYVPNTVIWDNIPVKLFVNDEYLQSYNSKTEALLDAVKYDYAKLMDDNTNKVVWDNYPGRECRTCDSVIQNQY